MRLIRRDRKDDRGYGADNLERGINVIEIVV